jgi:hypothetical protein
MVDRGSPACTNVAGTGFSLHKRFDLELATRKSFRPAIRWWGWRMWYDYDADAGLYDVDAGLLGCLRRPTEWPAKESCSEKALSGAEPDSHRRPLLF